MARRAHATRVLGGSLVLVLMTGACESGGDSIVVEVVDSTAAGGTTTSTPCKDGKAGGFPCKELDLMARLKRNQIGASGGIVNDLWGWTDRKTGTEWALVGHSYGTSFISLKKPLKPEYVGILPRTSDANPSIWRDIKVYRDHAFIVSDAAGEHGMQVFDLTRLRDVDDPPETFTPTTTYHRIHSAHNIVINEETGFAYSVGGSGGGRTCGGGLHMIDISTPSDPEFAGCFAHKGTGRTGSGYTHDAVCVVYRGPDSEHRAREVCFGSNETRLSIVDVSDKGEPEALAAAAYPDVGYAHQGWLDDDHEYLYMNDEFDEFGNQPNTRTLVWDIRDLDDPVVAEEFFHETEASDHNLYVAGDFMYQSNYMIGLRILSIADREDPVEVAFFDTEPGGSNGPSMNGSWSNYPFFASGVIAVTSMGKGVFFLKRSGK